MARYCRYFDSGAQSFERAANTILLKNNGVCPGNDESLLGVTLESDWKAKIFELESVLLRVKNEDSNFDLVPGRVCADLLCIPELGLGSGWTILTSASYQMRPVS